MIKLQIIGNLGKDATVNNHNGKTVINFSVAHTYKDGQGAEHTTWVECSYWKENANIATYLLKGTKVYVEGTPNVRAWEANGKHGASLSVNVFSVELCGGQPAQAQTQPYQQQYQQQPQQFQQPQYQQQPQQFQQPQAVPHPNQQPPQQWAPPAQGQGGLPF